MATEYFKAAPLFFHSGASDYAVNKLAPFLAKETSGALQVLAYRQLSAVITTGTTLDLSMFASVAGLFVQNLDTTNFVEVRWTDQATANKQKLIAGAWMFVPLCTVASDVTIIGDTATCLCDVLIVGL
jgi:hypothetical protein